MVWSQKVIPVLGQTLPVLTGRHRQNFLNSCENKAYKIEIAASGRQINPKHDSYRTKNYQTGLTGRIVSVKDIRKTESAIEKTLLIQVDLDESAGSFSLADNIAFFPKNSKSKVHRVVKYFEVDPNSYVNVSCQDTKEAEVVAPFPSAVKIKSLLRSHLDLHAPVTFANQQGRCLGPEQGL